MIKTAVTGLKGLFEAARATRVGSFFLGTTPRALLTTGAVAYYATRSNAAQELQQFRA